MIITKIINIFTLHICNISFSKFYTQNKKRYRFQQRVIINKGKKHILISNAKKQCVSK